MSNVPMVPMKGRRAVREDQPAAEPTKLDTDGAGAAPSPLAAPAPSVAEAKVEEDDKPAATPAIPPPPPPAPTEPPKARTYKVWAHGTLQHNGKTYASGAELTLDVEVASKIPCLEPV